MNNKYMLLPSFREKGIGIKNVANCEVFPFKTREDSGTLPEKEGHTISKSEKIAV